MLIRSIWVFLWRSYRKTQRQRALWWRALACMITGAAVLLVDYESPHDTRFLLRPRQPVSKDIVLVTVDERDWTSLFPNSRNVIRPLKEITSLTDSFFWHEETIQTLLEKILACGPEAIAITFYFGDNLDSLDRVRRKGGVWTSDKVIWSGDTDSTGRVLYPAFADVYASNVGLSDFRADTDLVARSFTARTEQVDHISWKLAHRMMQQFITPPVDTYGRVAINFRGPQGSYPKVKLTDVLRKQIDPSFFRNKLVIIGAEDTSGHRYLTPVGPLSRGEMVATTVNNWLGHQWIHQSHFVAYTCYLLIAVSLGVWALVTLPQAVALTVVGFWILILAATSAWAFDIHYYWLPVRAPVVSLLTCYVLFLSYELGQRERLAWRLEQEKRYLTEVEQIKHNFVSLISHDLKTPIARIQGVVDRLLADLDSSAIKQDLQTIRLSSVDLHRYIQTILQLSKVESRDLKVISQVVDINELIDQVLRQLRGLATDKHVQLETRLEPLFSVEIDPTLIREVIVNLVENAIKYTPGGGQILVTSEERDDRVRVMVSDTGPGIPVEEQGRIWDKFYRGQSVAMSTKGTGLGMYLVRYFVELHGGRVFLESAPGKGTTVGFDLPLATDSDGPG